MKPALAIALAGLVLFSATAKTASAASKTNQVSIYYVPPKNPAHQPIYERLKERRALEKLQEILSPFRLPSGLKLSLADCNGEADAFYGNGAITICYEYIYELWKNRPAATTAAGIAPIDTIVGPFFDTSLHEFGHALIELLNLPVLGREEDAADQLAAFIELQFGPAEARRLIMGTLYAYVLEAKKTGAAPQSPEVFAKEHGTPLQRAYNIGCIAYGADPKLFADFVTNKYLPEKRAAICKEEYEQIQEAFEALVEPHIDHALADKVLDKSWLPHPAAQPPHPPAAAQPGPPAAPQPVKQQ